MIDYELFVNFLVVSRSGAEIIKNQNKGEKPMQSRNIAASKYEALEEELIQYANPQPFNPLVDVPVDFNGRRYTVTVLLERKKKNKRKLYALYAVYRESSAPASLGNQSLMLTTEPLILNSLIELILFQGLAPM